MGQVLRKVGYSMLALASSVLAGIYQSKLGHVAWLVFVLSGLVVLGTWIVDWRMWARTKAAWVGFWHLSSAVPDAAVAALPISPPSLRDRIFQICSELESFLAKHGKRPNPYLIPMADKDEFARTYIETVQSWDNKFQAEYWAKFKHRVIDLRHELAMDNVTDDDLDKRLGEAETSALGDITVRGINDGLRKLASRL